METEHRVSPLSRILEARLELRKHLVLETALIEKIGELPEDDFCRQARESMSLGAGYAYLQRDNEDSGEQWTHIFSAYFALQPHNRYLGEVIVRKNNELVLNAALDLYEGGESVELDSSIDLFAVEGLVAFIEGFVIARDYFAEQDYEISLEEAEVG